jgi:hypothetical protein
MKKQQEEHNASRSKLFFPAASAELKFLRDSAAAGVKVLY